MLASRKQDLWRVEWLVSSFSPLDFDLNKMRVLSEGGSYDKTKESLLDNHFRSDGKRIAAEQFICSGTLNCPAAPSSRGCVRLSKPAVRRISNDAVLLNLRVS